MRNEIALKNARDEAPYRTVDRMYSMYRLKNNGLPPIAFF